jgi:hypothetical protein
MNSETVTPLNLFDKPVRYIVPLFQRPYVWEKEKQWVPLWEDIRRIAEGYDGLVAAGEKPEKALAAAPKHFLGAVVVQLSTGSAKYIPERFVIDGQQRLTTLQLIIDAAKGVVEAEELAQAGLILGALVRNEERYHTIADDQFKVWPTNLDRPVYRDLMSLVSHQQRFELSLISSPGKPLPPRSTPQTRPSSGFRANDPRVAQFVLPETSCRPEAAKCGHVNARTVSRWRSHSWRIDTWVEVYPPANA